jgi:putative ABC transport system ATP-binding protein
MKLLGMTKTAGLHYGRYWWGLSSSPFSCCRASARHILQRVGLGARLRHYPNQLSGGEQQRVAIARAFVTQPKILFADEPTGNLDRSTGSRVAELLFSLNREHGTTLVIVTHDETLAAPCKHTLELDNGRIKA